MVRIPSVLSIVGIVIAGGAVVGCSDDGGAGIPSGPQGAAWSGEVSFYRLSGPDGPCTEFVAEPLEPGGKRIGPYPLPPVPEQDVFEVTVTLPEGRWTYVARLTCPLGAADDEDLVSPEVPVDVGDRPWSLFFPFVWGGQPLDEGDVVGTMCPSVSFSALAPAAPFAGVEAVSSWRLEQETPGRCPFTLEVSGAGGEGAAPVPVFEGSLDVDVRFTPEDVGLGELVAEAVYSPQVRQVVHRRPFTVLDRPVDPGPDPEPDPEPAPICEPMAELLGPDLECGRRDGDGGRALADLTFGFDDILYGNVNLTVTPDSGVTFVGSDPGEALTVAGFGRADRSYEDNQEHGDGPPHELRLQFIPDDLDAAEPIDSGTFAVVMFDVEDGVERFRVHVEAFPTRLIDGGEANDEFLEDFWVELEVRQ